MMQPTTKLSKREELVLYLASIGKSTKEVADLLSLAPKTIERYKARVQDKLGTKNIAHSVAEGFLIGILPGR